MKTITSFYRNHIGIISKFGLFAVVIILSATFHTETAMSASKEYKLKAAFLYQFAKFVKWPKEFGNTITIGIFGQSPYGDALDTIRGKTAQGKTIKVALISSIDDLKNCCQMVFISTSEQANFKTVLSKLDGTSVLTVGEMEGMASQGGIIGFVQKGTKLKFEVNLKAAKDSGLNLSSQLLKVGIILK